ncbi:MAG: hypothetical protein HQK83_13915 [Fibrobacteria bacterium]|nr:hypothetical protein [Fibrobacteria bacterium]
MELEAGTKLEDLVHFFKFSSRIEDNTSSPFISEMKATNSLIMRKFDIMEKAAREASFGIA